MKEKRNIYVEILRCFAMIGVISLHFNSHGGILDGAVPLSSNWLYAYYMEALFFVSVPLFYLISSYYLYDNSKGLKCFINRSIKLWLEVLFYSVAVFIISVFGFKWKWTSFELLQAIFPIMFRGYGFFNSYLLLTIMAYPLSIFIKNISKSYHEIIIAILVVICCVLPYISFTDVFWIGYGQGNTWLILLFLIGGYLRKYKIPENSKIIHIKYFYIAIFAITFTFFSKVFIAIGTKTILGKVKFSSAFYGETPLLNLIAVVALFLFALTAGGESQIRVKIWIRRIVYLFARNSFAVYLITDNNIMRKILWPWLNLSDLATGNIFKLIAVHILVVVGMFIPCVLIENIRKTIENKLGIANIISEKIYECTQMFIIKLQISKNDKG